MYKIIAAILALCGLLIAAWVASIVTPRRIARTTVMLRMYGVASSMYFQVYGTWPSSLPDLFPNGNPRKKDFVTPGSRTNDAWRRPIGYIPFDASVGYGRVYSLGRDGVLGGTGSDADIEVRFSR